MLTVKCIGKKFGGITALSEFEISVASGDLIGLIGPNGAGKTTALNVLTGLLKPDTGIISFESQDITKSSPECRSRLGICRTFQNIRLFDELTVLQNIMAGAHARYGATLFPTILRLPSHRASERKIAATATKMLEIIGISDFIDKRADALSYGDRRRVEIARALACAPKLLLLDEPAAGMNENEKHALSKLILSMNNELGLSIILVEHNVPMVSKLCQKLVVLNKGETIASGDTIDVLKQPNVIEVYLGRRRRAMQGGA